MTNKHIHHPVSPFILRTGIAGHRMEADSLAPGMRKRTEPDVVSIRMSIKQILTAIRAEFQHISQNNSEFFDLDNDKYSQSGGDVLRMVTSLASGADQWAAAEAVNQAYELQVILPFERDEYSKDFVNQEEKERYYDLISQSSSVVELDGISQRDEEGHRLSSSHSYEAAGLFMLLRIDLLLAVWDGKDSMGIAGTGWVVKEALKRCIPVIWIPWQNPNECRISRQCKYLTSDIKECFVALDGLGKILQQILLSPERISNETE